MSTEENLIKIQNQTFTLIDELDNIPIVDSFVKNNKIGSGNGEARLYIGPKVRYNYEKFFDNFQGKCFFLKNDFEEYLKDAKFEYEEQEQKYQKDISKDWQKYFSFLNNFSDKEYFVLKSANGAKDTSRYYVRSGDKIFREYFRNIMLPVISYVSILKLKDSSNKIFFLFRPTLSYSFNPYYHPAKTRIEEKKIKKKVKNNQLSIRQKEQISIARIGQGSYRQKLLEESSECIITRVNDERILIASHIKPWNVSSDDEKIDHNNGLTLTPTYDRLFDQGFISFDDDGVIKISPYISPLNLKKLNLANDKKYMIPASERRMNYLKYHRDNIFKK